MTFAKDCLAGRRILVTGASSGIGRDAAIRLSHVGAQLAITGRDVTQLGKTASMLNGENHAIYASAIADAEAMAELIATMVDERGPFHGVFHSAGSSLVLPAKLTKNKHIEALFDAAVMGALGVARAAGRKGTVEDGGSLVFMSSVSSLRGRAGMVAYSAAKAAVDGMVRALAAELAPRRIRVNSIVSGAVATAMHDEFVKSVSETLVDNYRNLHMLGFGQPSDIADAATFLFSDASRWVTGTGLVVDGGYTAK